MSRLACQLLTTGVVVCALAQPAAAQWYYQNGPSYHASTVGESYARGMGSLVASAGAANVMNSEAAKRYEEARSTELDNRLKATQTYFEMRRVNQEARAAERERRQVQSASVDMAAHEAAPRAAASQIDPHTGEIHWPGLLAAADYETSRKQLDGLFAQRASYGQLDGDHYLSVQDAIAEWKATLKKDIRRYKPADYVAATKFLEMLANEARQPAA